MKKSVKDNYNIDKLDFLFEQIIDICNANDCQLQMYVNYTSVFQGKDKETYYHLYPNTIKRNLKDIKKDSDN